MSELIQRIEEAAKGKGLTFNRIERDCGLGNGTIKRWSTQSPRLDKLVLVADYIGVSLDYIVHGTLRTDSSPKGEEPDLEAEKERQGLTCDGLPLAEDEVDLVAMYRLLPPSHREGRRGLRTLENPGITGNSTILHENVENVELLFRIFPRLWPGRRRRRNAWNNSS